MTKHFTTRGWYVSMHKDQDHLVVTETTTTKQYLADKGVWFWDEFSHHVLNNLFMREPMWKIPVGKPKYDDEDPEWLTNSVGSLAYDIVNWGFKKLDRVRPGVEHRIPITREQVFALSPEAAAMWHGDDDDDEEREAFRARAREFRDNPPSDEEVERAQETFRGRLDLTKDVD